MRPVVFSANLLRQFLRRNRIATLPQLKELLGTKADITIFRKLKELSYRTSYSHRGSFYTLDEIAAFDEHGLWSFDSVWFSRHGTLVATAEVCVTQAPAGYFASELETILYVPVKEPLLRLVEQDRIARQTVSGFLWLSLAYICTAPATLERGSSSCRHGKCCWSQPPLRPLAFRPMNCGRRLSCLPACSTNNNGVCTLAWSRSSWVETARSPTFSIWTHTPWPKDDGNCWPRRWRWAECGAWGEDANRRKKNARGDRRHPQTDGKGNRWGPHQ